MTMRPMTLWESGDSSGTVSLSGLLNGDKLPAGECLGLDLERVAFLVCRGGWPQTIHQREKIALMRAFEASFGSVSHYLDKSGLECDAIVHLRNGTYGLVEVKLGGESLVNDGAETLNALARIVDTSKMKSPAFKMVLTAVGDVVYRRADDGVVVCPISALRP